MDGVPDPRAVTASLRRALDRAHVRRGGTRVTADAFIAAPFLRDHSDYESFEAFRADAPVELDVPLDDSAAHRRRVNEFVADATEFETWDEMETRAAQEALVDHFLRTTT